MSTGGALDKWHHFCKTWQHMAVFWLAQPQACLVNLSHIYTTHRGIQATNKPLASQVLLHFASILFTQKNVFLRIAFAVTLPKVKSRRPISPWIGPLQVHN